MSSQDKHWQKIKRGNKDDKAFMDMMNKLVGFKAKEEFRLECIKKEWKVVKCMREEKHRKSMKWIEKGIYCTITAAFQKLGGDELSYQSAIDKLGGDFRIVVIWSSSPAVRIVAIPTIRFTMRFSGGCPHQFCKIMIGALCDVWLRSNIFVSEMRFWL